MALQLASASAASSSGTSARLSLRLAWSMITVSLVEKLLKVLAV